MLMVPQFDARHSNSQLCILQDFLPLNSFGLIKKLFYLHMLMKGTIS